MDDAILFLCSEGEINRERRGYFDAFSKEVKVVCLPQTECDHYYDLENLLPTDLNILLVLEVDSFPRVLPHGLTKLPVPSACFQIDTYEQVKKRTRNSMLFDYAFVFHPGYESYFQKAGHPKTICLPHAVEGSLFVGEELERIYEVGWVGRTDLEFYSFRRQCLRTLKTKFKMNDPDRYYDAKEMVAIYKQSIIVVNLSRDDYLQDANLRCFEAMAAGALLLTPKPTELSSLGFVEGKHYIAFEDELQMENLVSLYLENESMREEIALAGRTMVLKEHTYDSRAKKILEIIRQEKGKLFAPARSWDEAKIYSLYAQYFADYGMIDSALRELGNLKTVSRIKTWKTALYVARAFLKKMRWSM